MSWHNGMCNHGQKTKMVPSSTHAGYVDEIAPDCKLCDGRVVQSFKEKNYMVVPSRQVMGDGPFVVVLSGGQDSTTAAAWACKDKSPEVIKKSAAVFFDYGQKHFSQERRAALAVSDALGLPLHMLPLEMLKCLGDSALTTGGDVNQVDPRNGLPSSFVPGRNLLLFTGAAALAYKLGHNPIKLVSGVCQTDFSGYPDCRRPFVDQFEQVFRLACAVDVQVYTPLMWLTKAESVKLMQELGQLDLLKHSHTCYNGQRPPCGKCPACDLRAKGFAEAGIADPLLTVTA